MKYQKINTCFLRDANNVIMPNHFTSKVFDTLKDLKWEGTEKVDGTNTRIELRKSNGVITAKLSGKTDNAQIPVLLVEKMNSIIASIDFNAVFPDMEDGAEITIFGEGYGYNIQSGGRYTIKGEIDKNSKSLVDFILFDVRVGNFWLNRKSCEDIAKKMKVKIVPIVGYFTIKEACDFVKKGYKSLIAADKDLIAEGLVLRTTDGLLFRNGERIITKIKYKDFQQFIRTYGESYTGEQPVNTKYK